MANKEVLFKLRFIILILSFITLDLVAKAFAENALIYGQSEQTMIPFIDLLLIYNSGIAFGIFNSDNSYGSYILLVVTIMISFYLIWMIVNETNTMKKYALSIITAGAFGNIIDRAIDNKVTDFLHLEILNFSFFIFNFADAFITIGAILLIYFELIYKSNNE
jgi:signal peptidase II|tara:strand:+ start:1160 stop:1648 length:489 start_codon:yes stop_codon:yes gene_type:complete